MKVERRTFALGRDGFGRALQFVRQGDSFQLRRGAGAGTQEVTIDLTHEQFADLVAAGAMSCG